MIKERLLKEAEADYKKFSSSLIPNIDNVLGIRIPLLRKIAKEIYESDWKIFLAQKQNEYMEETMLQGMVIGLIKDKPEVILKYIADFVPKINNWAVCDTFCCSLKFTKKNKKLVWDFILPYLHSDKEYEIRFGLVMLLGYFVEDDYIDEILMLSDTIKHDGYYVKMGLAWALSICYIKFPEKTYNYLKNNKLEDWTYNKTIQKIIESYRISPETKNVLRQMKRR